MRLYIVIALRVISGIVLTALVSIALVLGFIAFTGKMPIVITTSSMEPTFGVGDVVVASPVETTTTDDIEPGDILAYVPLVDDPEGGVFPEETDGVLIVHEVISVDDDDTLTLKGTANTSNDPPVLISQVKGSVDYVIEGAGPTVEWVTANWWIVAIGFVLTLGLATASFTNLKVQATRKRNPRTVHYPENDPGRKTKKARATNTGSSPEGNTPAESTSSTTEDEG